MWLQTTETRMALSVLNIISDTRAHWFRRSLSKDIRNGALSAILRTEIVFVHVPKCGGKSVIRQIYGLDNHDWFGHADIHFYRSLLGQTRFQRFLKFAVFRDPVARCRSGFYFGKQGGFGFDNDRKLQAILRDIDFATFVSDGTLEMLMDRFVIFKPQWMFTFDPDGRMLVDRLIRLDRLKSDLAGLLGQKFKGDNMPHENKSKYQADQALHPAVENKIRQLYRKDFELFSS